MSPASKGACSPSGKDKGVERTAHARDNEIREGFMLREQNDIEELEQP
jgi:hypothetical protein